MSRKQPTPWETAATVVLLVGVLVVILWLAWFGFARDDGRQPVLLEPIPATVVEIPEPDTTSNPAVTWCEGFASGVVLTQWVDATQNQTSYTFPTQEKHDAAVLGCLERGLPREPFPRGQVVVP